VSAVGDRQLPGRIEAVFARLKAERRTGLAAFLTVGYPDIDSTLRFVPALIEGGADIIELGMPFSDPLAEGPTIQRSSYRALQQGVTPRTCLDVAAKLRSDGVDAPLVLMGYYNPLLAYGLDAFARDDLATGLEAFVRRVRRHTHLPIAVGFGISQRKHFQAVGRIADAAVIGSAIIDEIDNSDPSEQAARLREYAEVVTGRRRAAT